jgi:polyhydroxyalkanoate synthesis regulator phasin
VEEGVGQLQTTGRIYRDQATERVSREAERLLQRMNLVPRDDFDALQRRVRTLEERVGQLESQLDQPVAGEPDPDDGRAAGE